MISEEQLEKDRDHWRKVALELGAIIEETEREEASGQFGVGA